MAYVSDLPRALQDKLPPTMGSDVRDLVLAFGELCYAVGKVDGAKQFQEGLSKCFESHFPKGH
jgi:hypothetical protein